jgi:hypothetical protein
MKSLTRFWFLLTVVLGLAVVPQGASAQVQPDRCQHPTFLFWLPEASMPLRDKPTGA